MAPPSSSGSDQALRVWNHVYPRLLPHALPDSRYHFDFLSFVPDFGGSAAAVERLVRLPCYHAATTLLVTPDNSLEGVRLRALQDGKTLLVATARLRRGFVLLDPRRIGPEKLERASWLDGMERAGMGRPVTLAQMRDEGVRVDVCVTGGLAFNVGGVVIWEGPALFEVQWAMLRDVDVLRAGARVVGFAHGAQVVDEQAHGWSETQAARPGEVQCDHVVTPERVWEVEDAIRPEGRIQFDRLDPDALAHIPPLQELKGMRMMEQIMQDAGFAQHDKKTPEKAPTAEEQMGIDMVERLLKGLKP